MITTVKLSSPSDIVAASSHLLGCTPVDTLGLHGLTTNRITCSAAIPQLSSVNLMPHLTHVLAAFARQGVDSVIVMAWCDTLDQAVPYLNGVRQLWDQVAPPALQGIASLADLIAITDGTFLTVDPVTLHASPPEPRTPLPDVLAAEFVGAGRPATRYTRAELAIALASDPAKVTATRSNLGEAVDQATLLAHVTNYPNAPIARPALAASLTPDACLYLGLHLDHANAGPAADVLTDLATHLPDTSTALDGIGLAAFANWLAGDGMRANILTERATVIAPDPANWPLILTAAHILNHTGQDPRTWQSAATM